jgi:hypothetical protein
MPMRCLKSSTTALKLCQRQTKSLQREQDAVTYPSSCMWNFCRRTVLKIGGRSLKVSLLTGQLPVLSPGNLVLMPSWGHRSTVTSQLVRCTLPPPSSLSCESESLVASLKSPKFLHSLALRPSNSIVLDPLYALGLQFPRPHGQHTRSRSLLGRFQSVVSPFAFNFTLPVSRFHCPSAACHRSIHQKSHSRPQRLIKLIDNI